MPSTPKQPTPPDPVATAAAQTASNKDTAQYNFGLNAVNQVTPDGSLTYSQTGTPGTPGGYTATTSLSPGQQKLYDLGLQTQTNLGQLGVDQSSKVAGILNTPFDLNGAINTQISDQATKLLNPVWQQRENAAKTDLFNQGITPGNEAYTNSMRDFGDERDRAYTGFRVG